MKDTILLQIVGVASCLTLANCSLWPYENSREAAEREGSGYSLDKPAGGSRYMAGTEGTTSSTSEAAAAPSSTTTSEVAASTTPAPSTPSTPAPAPSTIASTPPSPPPAAAPQPAASAPTYGTPVPGRRGFVYPPGVDAKPENMVDVRDFQPGQKVRDPRTGKIFLVP